MMLYYGDATAFDPKILRYILNHPEHLQFPDLVKRGMIQGSTLTKQWRHDPDENHRYAYTSSTSVTMEGITTQCGMALLHSWLGYGWSSSEFDEALVWYEDILKALKYTKVLVTLNALQKQEQNNLERNGYKKIDEFHNRRSRKDCVVLTKELKYE
jgi:hypothetical protein